MAIRNYRPITPGTRTRVASDFAEVTGRGRERGDDREEFRARPRDEMEPGQGGEE